LEKDGRWMDKKMGGGVKPEPETNHQRHVTSDAEETRQLQGGEKFRTKKNRKKKERPCGKSADSLA